MTKILCVELNTKQMKKYTEWCNDLRKVFGEVGQLTWTISTNGIGESVNVTSINAPNHPLDLTDIESW